jgi:hypothetical protein
VDEPVVPQGGEELDPVPAGEMVVARTRRLQRLGGLGLPQAAHLDRRPDAAERLDRLRDVGAGQLVVAVPALSQHRHQAAVEQPGEVGAGGLRRDIRGTG